MHRALSQFRDNIERVRALGGLFGAIQLLTTAAVDATDLLRSQIVMSVSALDHYVHELTLAGMLEVYNGARPSTAAYLRFEVPLESTMAALRSEGLGWLDAAIRKRHAYAAFQQPDKVAEAIRLFSSCELWRSVARAMEATVEDVKSRLSLIVERRNKIVHEADLDPSYPGVRWPVAKADADGVIDFIEDLCERIHSSVV